MEEGLTFQVNGVRILEKLIREHPTSTDYQFWLAKSVRDVGWSQGVMLWKPKEAETEFIASFPLWRKLAETYPAVNVYQAELGQAYAWFGWFQTYSGRWPQALDNLRKSLAIFQRLIESEADLPWNRLNLALTSQYAGEVLQDMGEESEAMEALRRSVVMGEKAVEGDPASAHHRMYLARHHEAVGTLLERVGKPAEALKTYSEAYALRRRNAEALPEDAWAQRDLAENRSLVGRLCRDTGKLPEALDAVQTSLPIRRKLVAGDPTNPKYQSFLSSDLILGASILLRLGRTAEARASIEEAIPIQTGAVERTPGYSQHAAVLAQVLPAIRPGAAGGGGFGRGRRRLETGDRSSQDDSLAARSGDLSDGLLPRGPLGSGEPTPRGHLPGRASHVPAEESRRHELSQPLYVPQRDGSRPAPRPRRLQEADNGPGGTGDEAIGFASVTAVISTSAPAACSSKPENFKTSLGNTCSCGVVLVNKDPRPIMHWPSLPSLIVARGDWRLPGPRAHLVGYWIDEQLALRSDDADAF